MRTHTKIQGVAFGLLMLIAPAPAPAGIAVSITIAPPVLPVYVQPPCPTDGYLWTPGYWAYGPDGYYWVPGVWIAPPRVGVLWTPGYWGFGGGAYLWHAGYWGPHVGFYGGVNYGFGYAGVGFFGGIWAGSVFRYNTAVVSVNNTVVRNVYVDRTVINNTTVVNRTSFNGPGGVRAQPSAQEQTYMREQHFQATQNQLAHEQTASRDRTQLASVNGGRPGTLAMNSVGGQRFNSQGRAAGVGSPAARTPGVQARPQAKSEVGQRQGEQQQRIGKGVSNGQLSAGQASRLEGREQNINKQVAADRAANGGKLAPAQKQQVNKEQNAASKAIANDRHGEKK